jgi:3-oxoadipate enol-lactonase
MIDIEDCRLHYRLDGPEAAPTLLLSNSLGTTLDMWRPQLAAFAADFRVLRYDSRGHGRSGVTPGPYSVDRLGRDALALLDALNVERTHVCGLSLGGMVGQWLGINAPARVDRLTLCNTAAFMGGDPAVWAQRIAAVEAGGMAAVVPGVVDRWLTKPFQERQPAATAEVRDMLLAADPRGYAATAAAVRDMDLRAGLSRITAPTLVVAGRHDVATPPEAAQAIADAIPGARLTLLDSAHLSNIEAAEAFTAAVMEFLTGRR